MVRGQTAITCITPFRWSASPQIAFYGCQLLLLLLLQLKYRCSESMINANMSVGVEWVPDESVNIMTCGDSSAPLIIIPIPHI